MAIFDCLNPYVTPKFFTFCGEIVGEIFYLCRVSEWYFYGDFIQNF